MLIGGLVFFGLTRTQVGRDGLRLEVERQFAKRYAGRLDIGVLKGNLLNDLFAGDLRIYDPDGRLVARIDSAVLRPSWRNVFERRFSTGALTLFRPDIELVRDENDAWNVARAFKKVSPYDDSERAPWSFSVARLRIIDGTVRTRNEGTLPGVVAAGHLFDYTRTVLAGLNATATVEWRADRKVIDLRAFTAALPHQNLAVQTLHGQFLLGDGVLALNQFEMMLGETAFRLSGSLEGIGEDAPPVLSLDLAESRLDFNELRRLFPDLPLADQVTAAARLQGSLDDLVVDHLRLTRGNTRMQAEGLVGGLPDSLHFDLRAADNIFFLADLKAMWPSLDISKLPTLDGVRVSLDAKGAVGLRGGEGVAPMRLAAGLDIISRAGHVVGDVLVERGAAQPVKYVADLRYDSLDVGRITERPDLGSRLNGRIQFDGTALALDALAGTLRLNLGPSRFAGRALDTLTFDVAARSGVYDIRSFFSAPTGAVAASGQVSFGATPAYRLTAATSRLDLGALFHNDSLQTQLNTRLSLEGSGLAWASLAADLALSFDSSTMHWNGQTEVVPPLASHLTINAPSSDEPRILLAGDIADLTLSGPLDLPTLAALRALWSNALAGAGQTLLYKPRDAPALTALGPSEDATEAGQAHRQDRVRTLLATRNGGEPVRLVADLRMKRFDLLATFLPMLAVPRTAFATTLDLTADADRLELFGDLHLDSLHTGSLQVGAVRADVFATAGLDGPPEEMITARLDVGADTVRVGRQTFATPHLALQHDRRRGHLTLTTTAHGRSGPMRLAAELALLPDRNVLTLTDLSFAVRDFLWTNAAIAEIELYRDAVVVPGLLLESRSDSTSMPQRLRVSGALSNAPTDTIHAAVENISLGQFSEMLALKRPIGGELNGNLALTGAFARPQLQGRVEVAALSLQDRVLGSFEAVSRYVPGAPEIAVDVAIRPVAAADSSALAAEGLIVERNNLDVGGMLRLPTLNDAGARDFGALDLTLDVKRADLFFFELIFSEILAGVEGYAYGEGAIRGTLRKPLFEGDLRVADGRFRVPRYNLAYSLDGAVRVDEAGFHIFDVAVSDKTGGRATAMGDILFNDYRYFSLDLNADLDDLQIIDVTTSNDLPFYGRIWASGAATLTGPITNASLRATDVVTSPESEVFIPITEEEAVVDPGFIVFTDSTGRIPDLRRLTRRRSILAQKPSGERSFVEGLNMDLNLFAPPGSIVHLVIDPIVGDVINAVGSGRLQLQRKEGEFAAFGTLEVQDGDYLFTAGEVFVRRFLIEEAGTITWDGDPLNAQLDLRAAYRTRASRDGLPPSVAGESTALIPLVVQLNITGRVATPVVNLSLAVDRRSRDQVGSLTEGLETYLNQPEYATEYATSVLLTNSFLLTTALASDLGGARLSETRNQLAFNSLSQLVASQLNRYLNYVLPNVDVQFGLTGETPQELDVTYGVALRLLDERLIIRGQGVYQNETNRTSPQGLEGEFLVEVRLSPTVSVEVFYRREGDVLQSNIMTSSTGAGLSYQTRFSTWQRFLRRLFGWMLPDEDEAPAEEPVAERTAN